jgi:Mg2+/Co2+ transporter CorC
MAFSSLGKESNLIKRLNGALSGDSPQDTDSLLQVIRDSKEDPMDIRKGLGKFANIGSEIAAGSFNQGVDDIRHLV